MQAFELRVHMTRDEADCGATQNDGLLAIELAVRRTLRNRELREDSKGMYLSRVTESGVAVIFLPQPYKTAITVWTAPWPKELRILSWIRQCSRSPVRHGPLQGFTLFLPERRQ